MKDKIIISSRIFIPKAQVDLDLLQKHYEFPNYDEGKCQGCPVYKAGERHSESCDECPAYFGIVQLWNEKTVKNKDYIGLPPGLPKKVENLLDVDLSKAIDLRPLKKLHSELKFTGKLYDGSVVDGRVTVNQKQVVKDWLEHKGGIIQIPPRGGKTVLAIYLILKLGYKAIIIANKTTLLQQFYDTIMGSKTRVAITNAKKLEKKLGRKLIGIISSPKDFDNKYDIALVNYQKFIRDNSISRVSKYLNNAHGTMALDEAHRGSAEAYLKFISRLNVKYRLALSATPVRKDGKDRLLREFIGNVVAKSTTTALVPQIEIVETGILVKNQYKLWVYAMKHLSKSEDRNKLIVRDVFKDLRDGHPAIIIPVDFVDHGNILLKMINRQAVINNLKRKEKWPEPIATFFTSSTKKSNEIMNKMLADVDSGKFRVLIAIRSMIAEGIDLLAPTMLYNIVPCSASQNAGAPLFFQLSNRVATFSPGKRQPIVRIYIDGMGQSLGCLKSLFFREILPGIRKKPPTYSMDKVTMERIFQITKEKDYMPPNKPGERVYSKDIVKLIDGGSSKAKSVKFSPGGFSSF